MKDVTLLIYTDVSGNGKKSGYRTTFLWIVWDSFHCFNDARKVGESMVDRNHTLDYKLKSISQ